MKIKNNDKKENEPLSTFSRFSVSHSDAKQGFFFNISAITLLAFSIVFLNSSSVVLYMLQSEARRSTPLLFFLTEI